MPRSPRSTLTRVAGAVVAVGLGLALSGCGGDDPATTGGGGGGEGGEGGDAYKIALLLPESKTTRYETFDRPLFEAAIEADCPDCEVLYSNADQDASKQQQQAEAALTQGANVLVLDPVDGEAAAGIAASAKSSGVPVVAYDRFVEGADYYVSFDNQTVGEIQAQTLVDLLTEAGTTSGDIVMINGSPTDPNAASFKEGAHSVLDGSGFTIAAEFDTPDWSPDEAQDWMEGQISAVQGSLVGVYAANDGTAGGAIAALKGGGVDPLPPVTGQDSELAAIQRILAGDQAMTIYKPIKPEAEAAAKAALALAKGEEPESTGDTDGVPSTILDPIPVTVDNVADTVVKDGIYEVADICTADVAEACAAAGIG